MNFKDAQKVQDTIRASDQVEMRRGANRAKINSLFNGSPPLNEEEARRNNVRINVNWGEGAVLAAQARRQYTNAFLKPGNFFKVNIPMAPEENKTAWGMKITDFINRKMKRAKAYYHLKQEQFASVVLHGIGPQFWYDKDDWMPSGIAVEDLRVPTDTKCSMENQPWFAIRHQYTPGELSRKVFGDNSVKGWNKKIVQEILDSYHDENYENQPYTWLTSPEKMAELYKQNAGFYASDKAPSIALWHFYFYDDEDPKDCSWKMRVLPEAGSVKGQNTTTEFLYTSDKPEGADLEEMLHIQFGDLNNKAPFMYHSVRSLGFLLMEPLFYTNLTRNRYLQHVLEGFNIWLRSSDPAGRAKASKVEMFDRAFIPEGISIVPNTERHQVNPVLVDGVMSQLRQLMSEASASYTQSTDNGTNREQTAYETSVKLAAVNSMMSALLTNAFVQEVYAYREICRRFCRKGTRNDDCKAFQKFCKEERIPAEFVDVEKWDIEPEIPLGSGNPSMEMAQVTQLMAMREKFDPTAQQEILHDFAEAVTNDPRKAERLVPLGKQRGVTDAQRDAEFAFATLMLGVPVQMKEGLSPIDQIETLLGLSAGKIASIEKSTNMATPEDLVGLQNVAQYVGGLIAQLAQDEAQKPRAKEYSDALGKLSNTLKGFADRLAQQGQGQQQDPAQAAKAQAIQETAQLKQQIAELNAEQKRQHKEIAFLSDQERRNKETQAQIERDAAITLGDIHARKIEAEHKPAPKSATNGKEN